MKPMKWADRFDKETWHTKVCNCEMDNDCKENLKSFIRSELAQQKESIVEMIRGMKGKEYVVVGLSKETEIKPATHELLDKSDIIKKLGGKE